MKYSVWWVGCWLWCLVTVCLPVTAQQWLDSAYLQTIRTDVYVLAADSMEGREAGTPGEVKAARYIASRFAGISVAPYFDTTYFQYFTFSDGYQYPEDGNHITITHSGFRVFGNRQQTLSLADFTPFPWGAAGSAEGRVVYAGYCLEGHLPRGLIPSGDPTQPHGSPPSHQPFKGKIVLARYDAPPGFTGRARGISGLMLAKARYAYELGAEAIILYDPLGTVGHVPGTSMPGEEVNIPVMFLHDQKTAASLPDGRMSITVTTERKRSTGKNVAAWINHGADQTIVVGAHYDHLGWGSFTSAHQGLPAIHPGADDNASGVAGMLALAQWLKSSDLNGKNYIFVAFSAEEKGLIGSRLFIEKEEITPENTFAMVNLDMIGRADPDEPVIHLQGTGTSPDWNEIIDLAGGRVPVRKVRGGITGSDQYHFYDAGIPVLFFFTGIHHDYHKPSDTPDKINYPGMKTVVELAIDILHVLDTLQTLPFERVVDESRGHRRTRQFSLGIVPGHGMDVTGLYVQEVTPQWPADKAGIIRGDVIIKLGTTVVENIHHYMNALQSITEGETVEVVVMRDGKPLSFQLQF